jgi:hypothetical protein
LAISESSACLVLDVQMAEMNGFDLQNRLTVPIIFILSGRSARLRARRFGRGRFRRLEIDVRQKRRRDDLGSQDLRQFDRVHDGAVLAAMTNYSVTRGSMNPWKF